MECLKQPILRFDEEDKGKIVVNFDPQLVVLIRESKYLDRMGFAVPETALNVTLQEDKYHEFVESLNAMLATYTRCSRRSPRSRPSSSRTTSPSCAPPSRGFELLNWNSLSIPEFTDSCLKAINDFQTTVKAIQKYASTIRGYIDAIANVELLGKKASPAGIDLNEVPEMAELAEDMERHRLKQLEELKRQYTQIGPLLMKVEELVANTNTGRSPSMASFYAHWEQQTFAALNKMVLATLGGFSGSSRRAQGEGVHTGSKSFALFVSAMLSAPEARRRCPRSTRPSPRSSSRSSSRRTPSCVDARLVPRDAAAGRQRGRGPVRLLLLQ